MYKLGALWLSRTVLLMGGAKRGATFDACFRDASQVLECVFRSVLSTMLPCWRKHAASLWAHMLSMCPTHAVCSG